MRESGFEPSSSLCFVAAPITKCVSFESLSSLSTDDVISLAGALSKHGQWLAHRLLLEGLLSFTQKFWLEI